MNKKKLYWGLGAFVALSLMFTVFATITGAGVFKEPLSPSETITEFHDYVINGKNEESKEFVADEILKSFENGGFPVYGSYGGFVRDHKNTKKEINPVSEKIDGNTATVEAKVITSTGREYDETYYMIKEDGIWKIAE